MIRKFFKSKGGLISVTVLASAAILFSVTLNTGSAIAESTGGSQTTEQTASYTQENLFEESYLTGQTVELPDVKISDGQKEYAAQALVTTPSGITMTGSSVTLSETGKYIVNYIAYKDDGTVLNEEYSFVSAEQLYSVSSTLSSIGYGSQLDSYEITKDVVLASISSRDTFEYTPMIDLNELNGSEFIEFFVTPEVIGTADVMTINIKLTDAYDEDNFVIIAIKKGTAAEEGAAWAELNSYITGQAVGQVPAGLEKGYTGITVYGTEYRLQQGTVWGANVKFALPGNPGYVSVSNPNNLPELVATQSLKLSLDNETGDIYANDQLVTVLKNSDIYGDTLWSGFTTGECYLSIYGETYNSSALGLGIISLNGQDFTSSEPENLFVDNTAPVISVDYGGETSVPDAVTGIKYPLFTATATDDYSGECQVTAKVYYCYSDGGNVRINVSGGAFTPIKEGTYRIVYTASDRYGNTAEEVLEVYADAESAPTLKATVDNAADGVSGVEYAISVPQFENARGNVSWYAVAALNGNSEISYVISSGEGTFIPEYSGTYTITYYFNDHIVSGELQKTFTVSASRTPVISSTPQLPKYIIQGCTYQLPELTGTVYLDGTPVSKTCEIYVSEDGGAERLVNGKLVTYASEYIEIIYRISDGDGAEIRSGQIPVVDVGYNGVYKIENYFYTEDFSKTTNKDYIRFTADAAEGGSASMTFINALQTFNFTMQAYASGNGFTTMNIYLTDSADDSVQLKFTYRNNSGVVMFSINGGEEVSLSSASFNDSTSPLYFMFDGSSCSVMPTGLSTLSYSVTSDLSGAAFSGFTNMSAYLTIELCDITNSSTASLNIVNINGQKISNVYTDNVKPQLSATTASGERVYGITYTIPAVYAGDVLDVVYATMKVTAPDGSYAVTVDGIELNGITEISRAYTLVLDQFGAYTVSYEVSDICGNTLTYEYVLRSADFTAPEIQIVSPVTEATAGTSIKVANIVITDNKDTSLEDFTIFVTVTSPLNRSYSLMDDNGECAATFTVTESGVWTVTYLVIDSSGNLATASYTITVK